MSEPIRVIPAVPYFGIGTTPDEAISKVLAAREAAAALHADAHGVEAEQASYGVAPAGERGPDGPAEDIGAPTASWGRARPKGPVA